MEFWQLLYEVVILLAASLLAGGIFARFGQSPLLGYLLAGMILGGPGSLHLVKSEHDIEAIAELGVSLLLFSLGLEFSLARLKSLGSRSLWAGVLQIVVTAVVGAAAALLFRLSLKESVAVGAMIALSSTACVLRVLMDRAEIDSGHGRNCLAILLVQDMAVVPLAVLMALLAGTGTVAETGLQVGRILITAAVLVVSLYLLLNFVAVKALEALSLESNRELTILLAVVTGLGSTWAAHQAGISPALGAFVAGMFLGSSPFATQVRADVASLRVVLLTLFFGAAGMVADPIWIAAHWYLVLAATFLLIAGKAALIWVILRWLGLPHQTALASGLCLAQIGEFAFVLGKIGRESQAVSESTSLLIVSTAIVTLFLSPFLVALAPRAGYWAARRLRSTTTALSDDESAAGHAPDVVIVGYGPSGQLASQPLAGSSLNVLVLDVNREGVRKAREAGFHAEIGDATQMDLLVHARVEAAKCVIITIPAIHAAETVLCHVRNLAPLAHVVVRARYQIHTHELEAAGAHVVVGDENTVGRSLAEQAARFLPSEPA